MEGEEGEGRVRGSSRRWMRGGGEGGNENGGAGGGR